MVNDIILVLFLIVTILMMVSLVGLAALIVWSHLQIKKVLREVNTGNVDLDSMLKKAAMPTEENKELEKQVEMMLYKIPEDREPDYNGAEKQRDN